MQKSLLILFLLTISNYSVVAQKREESKMFFSAGHGIGNIWTKFLKSSFEAPEYKVTSNGPISLVTEYRVYKKISAGISLTYSKIKGDFNKRGFEFSDELIIFTGLIRANYHPILSKTWDLYFGGGIGYVNAQYNNTLGTKSSNVPGELGYSAQAGVHYYFLKNFGVYSELGYVNGSFLQLGIVLTLL